MSTAHTEALAMGLFSAFFALVSVLAFRAQRRSGLKSQWRYVGLIAAVFGLVIVTLNLNGVVLSGV